jgi:ADP-ribose pyrophosphatase YjhB (NUDIX family)
VTARSPVLGVGAVIVDHSSGEPRVVLIRRAHPPMQGCWTLPGGRVEFGERLIDAIAREIREETGLEVDVGSLVEVVEVIDGERHFVIFDYRCTPRAGELRAGSDAAEVARVRPAELAHFELTDAVKGVIGKALA